MRCFAFCLVFILGVLFAGVGHSEDLDYFKHNSLLQNRYLQTIFANYPPHPESDAPALTNKGTTNIRYCNLTPLMMLSNHHFTLPIKNQFVIDIGSGYGACAREFVFLGYKVFSIDDMVYSDHYKNKFCDDLPTDSLSYILFKKYPTQFSESDFEKMCNKLKRNNTFIAAEFPEDGVLEKLPHKWGIVPALNVFHFMSPEKIEKSLKIIKERLDKNGQLVVAYPATSSNIKILRKTLNDHFKEVFEFTNQGSTNNTIGFVAKL